MDREFNETMKFDAQKTKEVKIRETLRHVYQALLERDYNPIDQIIGYILSGDPTYITSHNNAREIIRNIERDELLEELVKFYISDMKED